MDVFFATGEVSGDLLIKDICKELRKQWYSINKEKRFLFSDLNLAGLVGKYSAAEGVVNVLERSDLPIIGYDPQKYDTWKKILLILSNELRQASPRVFIAVSHHLFNLPLATKLPPKTKKILIAPPEIWGWQINWKGKLLYHTRAIHLIFAVYYLISKIPILCKVMPQKLQQWQITDLKLIFTIIKFVIHRGRYSLKLFDKLMCITPINAEIYQKLYSKRKKDVVFVGHPAARYSRESFKDAVVRFRKQHLIPENVHMLNIFPGSRNETVNLLLPEMLKSALQILNKHSNIYCYVSIADKCLARYIVEQIDKAKINTGAPQRLGTTTVDAKILLANSSHTLLSSGTITLYASLLGIPGTVMYDLDETLKLLRPIVTRQKIGTIKKIEAPFALPNALLLYSGWPKEKLPYEEFVLPKKTFNISNIIENIEKHIRAFPRDYSFENAPCLHRDTINAVRQTITPKTFSSAEAIIAKGIIKYLR